MKKILTVFIFINILYNSIFYAFNIPTSLIPKQPTDIIKIESYYGGNTDKQQNNSDSLINPYIIKYLNSLSFDNISFDNISFDNIVWSEVPKRLLMLFLDIRFLFLILFVFIQIAFLAMISSINKFNS